MKHHCAVAFAYSFKKTLPPIILLEFLKKQKHRGQDALGIFMKNNREYFYYTTARNLFASAKQNIPDNFSPNLLVGHLRYQTFGTESSENIQPYVWKQENLIATLSGNFNITNIQEIAKSLQQKNILFNPNSDAEILLKFFLLYKTPGKFSLQNALQKIDGGFFLVLTLNNQAYLIRDPNGIRPAYYVHTENFFAAASEEFPLTNTLSLPPEKIREIPKGHFLFLSPSENQLIPYDFSRPFTPCSLEKIYFSSPQNKNILKIRKKLGKELARQHAANIPKEAFFCYVPNSAKDAFSGFCEEFQKLTNRSPRILTLIRKQNSQRTFIAPSSQRSKLTQNVYQVLPYKLQGKTLVCIEDSIIRGNTLQYLLPNLFALNPEKIIVLSASPMFKFPDFYGIDIASLEELIAFRALNRLLLKRKIKIFPEHSLREIYAFFSERELAEEINRLLSPAPQQTEIRFLSLNKLKKIRGTNSGTWYFDGKYPTKGGENLLQIAIQNVRNNIKQRAYALKR